LWLADCLRDGLRLIPPEAGSQATMIASDWVIGDHGSTTAYAAAQGCPVLLAEFLAELLRKHSVAGEPGARVAPTEAACTTEPVTCPGSALPTENG
jgi:hypothetical protein